MFDWLASSSGLTLPGSFLESRLAALDSMAGVEHHLSFVAEVSSVDLPETIAMLVTVAGAPELDSNGQPLVDGCVRGEIGLVCLLLAGAIGTELFLDLGGELEGGPLFSSLMIAWQDLGPAPPFAEISQLLGHATA